MSLKHARVGYGRMVAITKSDTVNIQNPADAVICITAGNGVFIDPAGNSVTITGCAAGQIYEIQCKRINSTNTTGAFAALYII